MILFNIAKKNVQKNFKGYFLYFFSIVFTVAIYYSFKNLQYNQSLGGALKLLDRAGIIFNTASIVIALFSILFIWYSNSFFIKKRKQEIGLYALLGIENKEIGLLLFFETLIIGLTALVIGILSGVLISKVMIDILIHLIGLDLDIALTISLKGIIDTSILFIGIFLVIAYQSNRIIYKFKLIDLFKAENISEKPIKESKLLALMSMIFILGGYCVYLSVLKGFSVVAASFTTLIMVIIGTMLFFSSLLYFIIKMQKKNEAKYYKGLNMLSTSQLLYRIRSNAKMLATIAILSATTLTAIGASISLYYSTYDAVERETPYSYTIMKDDKNYVKEFEQALSKSKNNKLINKSIFTYITLNAPKETKNGFRPKYIVISQSNLNQILKINKHKEVDKIKNNEFIYVNPKSSGFDGEKFNAIDKDGKNIELKLKSNSKERLYNLFSSDETFVVSDSQFENLKSNNETSNYYTYNITNPKDETFNQTILKLLKKYETSNELLIVSYYENLKSEFSISGLLMFIGVFIGLVFIICTGSIIFFKLLSEGQDEAPRYAILKKIGVEDEDIKTSVYKQVGVNFLIPLAVGSMHSTVANYVICRSAGQNLSVIMMWTLIPYSIIYIIYYLITSKFYFNIVTKSK
ncbi:ftsX-like permease family protein [[Clostridium] bifermentans ATCC 638]|uniref:FtsX-like permease family protein n=1 Tax=Paraclostridium bifermentans ATCC 638 = DSM 14991 TaxID=1233171 RepID=T4VBY5_PARBF|nr:ABC transporter permease [Paraclostridium bifermentans]EQK41224.1 ftsX-like permease family protein [[Clostridium] bifermentans ATCC 638] [Paraclostridium bifermentans ATCC 638 = DSM 14991]RIZ57911.1 ABC transporter permease [Paraclostridium bifermentans]UAG18562.1 ABC transporter permease [Paraclostridium bifermentans]